MCRMMPHGCRFPLSATPFHAGPPGGPVAARDHPARAATRLAAGAGQDRDAIETAANWRVHRTTPPDYVNVFFLNCQYGFLQHNRYLQTRNPHVVTGASASSWRSAGPWAPLPAVTAAVVSLRSRAGRREATRLSHGRKSLSAKFLGGSVLRGCHSPEPWR